MCASWTASEGLDGQQAPKPAPRFRKRQRRPGPSGGPVLGGSCQCDEESPGRPIAAVTLSGTKVTDAGLEYLRRLTSLEWLSLRGTRVTDVGLEHLKGLTFLQEVGLRDTHVTDAGVNELRKALPNCIVYRH